METTNEQFEISYRKRPKLNPVTEQEDTIKSVEITDTDTMVERSKGTTASRETQQPSTSNTQIIERQLSVDASSFSRPTNKEKGIKDRYKEIKFINEKLKVETYAQYLKHTPANQRRLMSTFDIKTRKTQVSFMQRIVQQPKTSIDYRKTNFEVLAKDVHPIDQIEFHKQAGEMIYSTLIGKAMVAHKLQNSLDKITAQYKLETTSSPAKDNRIKSLEDLVIELGHDPNDIKAAKKLIKKKNEDIATLKKQLKLPHSEYPQTKEVLESQTHQEEMMDLVLQLNDQLKEMEKELDSLIQLKTLVLTLPMPLLSQQLLLQYHRPWQHH